MQQAQPMIARQKMLLYTRNVKWCGWIIDRNGNHLDPRKIEAIRTMEAPMNVAELYQFIHGCRWMRYSVPAFHQREQPLNDILERGYKKSGKRMKSVLKNVLFCNLWHRTQSCANVMTRPSAANGETVISGGRPCNMWMHRRLRRILGRVRNGNEQNPVSQEH